MEPQLKLTAKVLANIKSPAKGEFVTKILA
jgi:hypothetical protein